MNQSEIIEDGGVALTAEALATAHVADIVEALNRVPEDRAVEVLGRMLPEDRAVEALDQPELERAAELVVKLPRELAGRLVSDMSTDRAAELVREIGNSEREDILARLDAESRVAILSILAYPEDSAGSIMTTEFVSVPANWTVRHVLDHIRKVERTRETVYAIYVVEPRSGRLLHSVGLRRLVVSEPAAPILDVCPKRKPVTVSPLTDRERVAQLISKYDLLAVPVVDHGRIIGIVTVDDVIDAILEESTEDVQKFGGMEALDEPYMRIGFAEMIRKRAGWLCVLFVSEMLTASAMQSYESELQKAIVLTLFIPLIMSSGGNSGSQATSLIIRALALREIGLRDWWRIALREAPTGIVLGAILGVVGIGRIAAWQYVGFFDYGAHWPLIALTVGLALVGIVTFGTLAGSMLPFLLTALRFDPASASAPFVATLVDVSGLVIYFSVAVLVLSGTLL